MKKEATSYRISVEAKQKIKVLAKHLGVNETSVIEIAIRKLVDLEGVEKEQSTEIVKR